MASANAVNGVIGYYKEATKNVVPAASTFIELPRTGGDVGQDVQTVRSAQLRKDGQAAPAATDAVDPKANVAYEFQHQVFDDKVAGAVRGAWSTVVNIAGSDIAADTTGGGNKLTSGGTDLSINLQLGQPILIEGFTDQAINGWNVYLGGDAGNLDLLYPIASEVAGNAVTIKGAELVNGVVNDTFALLVDQQDLTQKYDLATGQVVDNMSLDIPARGFITGSVGYKGMDWQPLTGAHGHTLQAAAETKPTTFVQAMNEAWVSDASIFWGIISMGLKVQQDVATTNDSSSGLAKSDILHGTVQVSGSLSVYKSDDTWDLRTKFKNGTNFPFAWAIKDPAGNHLFIRLPDIFFSGEPGRIGGTNDRAVTSDFTWEANPAETAPGQANSPIKTIQFGRVLAP